MVRIPMHSQDVRARARSPLRHPILHTVQCAHAAAVPVSLNSEGGCRCLPLSRRGPDSLTPAAAPVDSTGLCQPCQAAPRLLPSAVVGWCLENRLHTGPQLPASVPLRRYYPAVATSHLDPPLLLSNVVTFAAGADEPTQVHISLTEVPGQVCVRVCMSHVLDRAWSGVSRMR